MSCVSVSALTRDLVNSCQPNGQGLYEKMYVFTRDELLSYTTDTSATDPAVGAKIITALTLKTGKKLKRWEGYKLSAQGTQGFSANDNGNSITHGFRFMVFDNSPEADAEIDKLTNRTDLVAIIKQQGEFGRWKLMGFSTGMSMTNLTNDSNDANNPGQFTLEFQAAQEKETAKTLRHKTATLDDTADYLETLATATA
ncbi:hypothetical protein [Spirosoma sp. KUDC1026]|uniref:hypothetical protein n=1 Tax=Spirosoma sp. KUDC1026 TaxID=2745947 RepID=UPI00159BA386|nr:hypothetical protein [Spirosoma sp. KUDC1026]QKZ15200.1 hypothetical protein HU175_22265 [Spirosoma sp. KUDC1026]